MSKMSTGLKELKADPEVLDKWKNRGAFVDESMAKPQEPKIEVKKEAAPIPKKKKLNKADYMFKALSDQTLVKMPGDIDGIDF